MSKQKQEDQHKSADYPKSDSPERDHLGPVAFQIEEKPPVRAAIIIPHRAPSSRRKEDDQFDSRPLEERTEEAIGLAEAIDLDITGALPVQLEATRPATLFGTGKVEELKDIIHEDEVELVIVDHNLSPGQQRNLERAWHVKILDRTGLILEIFGRRAATKEGRLQVELAHLTYQKSRLVRSWTHLERQRGGRGFLGGPGETQLEADKRQLQSRILRLTKDLEKVRKTRELHRSKRRQVPYPIIALVGYTNAGKSTLFNRLTGADVLAEDQLFATLDPTMRAIELPSGAKAILSDTVGFVANLPTQLVAAFRATLEEVLEADIILHVEDAANPARELQRRDVVKILKELGIGNLADDSPILNIWNKTDLLNEEQRADLNREALAGENSDDITSKPIFLSAMTGEGVGTLYETLDHLLSSAEISFTLTLPPEAGKLVSWLYENARVEPGETHADGQMEYHITLAKQHAGRLEKHLQQLGLTMEKAASAPLEETTKTAKRNKHKDAAE